MRPCRYCSLPALAPAHALPLHPFLYYRDLVQIGDVLITVNYADVAKATYGEVQAAIRCDPLLPCPAAHPCELILCVFHFLSPQRPLWARATRVPQCRQTLWQSD